MTFLEAAIEILRNADAPMHFSEVARLAVEENLLSHVGRDPEAAMRSCLTSAVRGGRGGEEPIIVREKPGYYGIRPGAALPDSPPRPEAKKSSRSAESDDEDEADSKSRRKKKSSKKKRSSKRVGRASADDKSEPRSAKSSGKRTEASAEESMAQSDEQGEVNEKASRSVEFEAPSGSGLEGVTDVALVMANAMSRLVEERPELREELDAIQQKAEEVETNRSSSPRSASSSRGSSRDRDRDRDRDRSDRDRDRDRDSDERGSSRRRRRRRRRGKKVDWAGGAQSHTDASTAHEKLLDDVAAVLGDAGARSLHVRQIAETLAGKGVLGGEISEIERAVTASVLLDVRTRGRSSRFVARGDARYQLQGTRLPEAAAKAEKVLCDAARAVERETSAQLIQWLQSLGARSLESLVRVYLQREGFQLLSALPPARGVGKLVVDDPDADDESRTLALVVPRRTQADGKLWEGELERNRCGSLLLFVMGDAPDDVGEGRVIGAPELGDWLQQQGLGIERMTIEVPVLDPTVIESIAGLDT